MTAGTDIFGNPSNTNVQGNTSDTDAQGNRPKNPFGKTPEDIYGNAEEAEESETE